MNNQQLFENLWHPICPEFDNITSTHVFKFFEAVEQHYRSQSDEVYALKAKNAYLLAQLSTNSKPPQPPCNNDHVADGCELFAHAMPKSEDIGKERHDDMFGDYSVASTTPQPTTDISELDWQTIETAPIDGTKVLAWNYEYGQRETFMRDYGEGSPGYALYKEGKGPLQCGWEWYEPQSGWISTWKPTHWKSIPSSPSTP